MSVARVSLCACLLVFVALYAFMFVFCLCRVLFFVGVCVGLLFACYV